jgi:hypothetical protein
MCEAQGAATTAKQIGNGDTANPLSDSFSATNNQDDGDSSAGDRLGKKGGESMRGSRRTWAPEERCTCVNIRGRSRPPIRIGLFPGKLQNQVS